MRFLATVERIQRDRPCAGWILTAVGVALPILASLGTFALFDLADFSSQVRDQYERPPGIIAYSLFALAIAFFALLFLVGLLLIWARVRRYVST